MTEERKQGSGGLLLVLAATALTFAVSVSFPFIAWDDPRYAAANPLVLHPLGQGWKTLLTTPALGYPQPVTVLSFCVNRILFGMSPWSFHLVNVALHLLNVGLVYRLGVARSALHAARPRSLPWWWAFIRWSSSRSAG